MTAVSRYGIDLLAGAGRAVFFLGEAASLVLRGRIRWAEVLRQIYEQGVQSLGIVAAASFASGAVLALQGYVMLGRFGAKEYVAHLVALSLVRELSPVFGAFIFSGKAGARIAAELGTMNVNEQILATRVMGVDPMELFVVPRMLACLLVLPGLVVCSEVVGIWGGYVVGTMQAGIVGPTYLHQTLLAVTYSDFFSGLVKTVFFGLLVGWVCCYQGFRTTGGSPGVGRFTTRAVSFSYTFVILANTVLTKVILAFWG